jgi:hypothetical protein
MQAMESELRRFVMHVPAPANTPAKRLHFAELAAEKLRREQCAEADRIAWRPATAAEVKAWRQATPAERRAPGIVRVYRQPIGDAVALDTLTPTQRSAGLMTLAEFRPWQRAQEARTRAAHAVRNTADADWAVTDPLPPSPTGKPEDDPRAARRQAVKDAVQALPDDHREMRDVDLSNAFTEMRE